MGLVHETVAALFRSRFGEKAPEISWKFQVTFAIRDHDETDGKEKGNGTVEWDVYGAKAMEKTKLNITSLKDGGDQRRRPPRR